MIEKIAEASDQHEDRQEVSEACKLIEFEAGDPGYPLWVGVWFPQDEVPAEAVVPAPEAPAG